MRVTIVAKKVQTKFLEEEDMQDLKLRCVAAEVVGCGWDAGQLLFGGGRPGGEGVMSRKSKPGQPVVRASLCGGRPPGTTAFSETFTSEKRTPSALPRPTTPWPAR